MHSPFTPTADDMEAEYDGVLVHSFENGGAIAVTADKTKALEALDTYYRETCGIPNLLNDPSLPLTDAYFYLDSGAAQFFRTKDSGWRVIPAPETAAGAVSVTWMREPLPGPVPEPYAEVQRDPLW